MRFLPQRAFMPQPTAAEPVNDSLAMRPSSTSASACEEGTVTTENAPAGRSVSARISASRIAPSGVADAGLSTNGQPHASAGPILWATRFSGKLKGVMKPHTPTGTRRVMPR